MFLLENFVKFDNFKKIEERADLAERTMVKLQKEVDRLEGK